MDTTVNGRLPRTSLTNTLVIALSQCQAQVQALEEHSRTIERLRRENDKLRQDLENERRCSNHHDVQSIVRSQMEQMFRKDAEKQAEIDSLRKQLKAAHSKDREWRQRHPHSSSSTVSSHHAIPDLLAIGKPAARPAEKIVQIMNDDDQDEPVPSPPRKRMRSRTPESSRALQQTSGNAVKSPGGIQGQKPRQKNGRARVSDARGAEAIGALAEDGEEHNRKSDRPVTGENNKSPTTAGIHKRLGALLDAPSPGPAVLARPGSRRGAAGDSATPQQRKASASGNATSTGSVQGRPRTPITVSNKRGPARGEEDEEPLRARPIQRLSLADFRINPAVNQGMDYAFGEVVRDREQRKCLPGCTRPECCGDKFRVLAETLPHIPGVHLSDDELLRDFLGTGSEDRIKNMTSTARENILQEARTKAVADTYGKMHRSAYERARSPPGFWNTEMPGTQEEEKNKEEARQRERQEVERRYHEAQRENGRWKFADE